MKTQLTGSKTPAFRHASPIPSSTARSKNKGLTTVEFTLVSLFFFTLIFTLIDFSIYGFVKLTMQHAVRDGTRYAVTGRADYDPEDSGDRTTAIMEKIRHSSMGLLDKVVDDDGIRVTDADNNLISGFGNPGQMIVINLDCNWPSLNPLSRAFTSGGQYSFTVSSSMKNEAFPGVVL